MRRTKASTLKRLGVIERRRNTKRRSGPVAMFPRLVSVDDWEVIASQAQGRLKRNVKEDGAVDYRGIPELELVPSG